MEGRKYGAWAVQSVDMFLFSEGLPSNDLPFFFKKNPFLVHLEHVVWTVELDCAVWAVELGCV